MKERLGDQQRIHHIQDAILEIESYLKGADHESFSKNSMMRFAILKQLEIIGEASIFRKKQKVKTRKLIGQKSLD